MIGIAQTNTRLTSCKIVSVVTSRVKIRITRFITPDVSDNTWTLTFWTNITRTPRAHLFSMTPHQHSLVRHNLHTPSSIVLVHLWRVMLKTVVDLKHGRLGGGTQRARVSNVHFFQVASLRVHVCCVQAVVFDAYCVSGPLIFAPVDFRFQVCTTMWQVILLPEKFCKTSHIVQSRITQSDLQHRNITSSYNTLLLQRFVTMCTNRCNVLTARFVCCE